MRTVHHLTTKNIKEVCSNPTQQTHFRNENSKWVRTLKDRERPLNVWCVLLKCAVGVQVLNLNHNCVDREETEQIITLFYFCPKYLYFQVKIWWAHHSYQSNKNNNIGRCYSYNALLLRVLMLFVNDFTINILLSADVYDCDAIPFIFLYNVTSIYMSGG